jgi:hypothetical protein
MWKRVEALVALMKRVEALVALMKRAKALVAKMNNIINELSYKYGFAYGYLGF